ncbi:hypothetical protein HZA26_02855, partial [Candidatus Nomurabacteria bacterium]|nr:hypothetical protein [Candidatus Nomurabacteria bacterium]
MKTKFILLISVFVFLGSTFCVFAAVPTTGLVGFWKLDEGSGTTTANSIPGGGLGTLINSPVWVKGVLDEAYALRFNGTNHQVKIADANLSNMSTITLSLWVHPFDNNGTLANSRIISKSDNSTSRFALSVGSDATSINFSAGFSGTAGSWKTPTNSLPLRIWHHVVVTYDYNT